jgi:CRISPR-associated endonuclease/helicase Cas3
MEYIAHIADDGRIQTVSRHSEVVSELCGAYAAESGFRHTGMLAGLVHDMGKLCADFTEYILGKNKLIRGQIDHAYAGARYIWELGQDGSFARKEAARLIAHIVISHHGLHDWVDIEQRDYFAKRVSNDERWGEITAAWEQLFSRERLSELLDKSAEELKSAYAKIDELASKGAAAAGEKDKSRIRAFYTGMLERFLQSCLIDADRTDTADFMSGATSEEPDAAAVWEKMHGRMSEKLKGFSGRNDRISALRQDISDRCAKFAENDVGAVRLVVPTGGGKTLSSLRFAIEYCRRRGMKRTFYTAPYMSILEQNSREFGQIAGDDNFLEHHSDIFAKTDNDEELAELELACERWTSPVIATTMVQLLNAMFSGKTASVRRFHRLGGSVIIIDEVQSLPLKCVYLFDLAVNFLTRFMGSAVILCSATQPQLDKTKYPVILDERSSMTGDYGKDFEAFRRTKAVTLLKNGGYDYDEAADICMEKFRENGDLLVIVNTRKSAAELFRRLSQLNDEEAEPAVMIHISTRLCSEHRTDEIERLRKLLAEKKPVICVTTQLIEAGVDISFRCVVRALAGLDSAAQAAGRCNRNGEAECRSVYILELGEERLTGLPEIRTGKSCAASVCTQCGFDDVLSPEAAAEYFERYYAENEKLLKYNCRDGEQDSDLVDMLSLNKNRGNKNKYTGQAFATAGREFEVIDNDTTPVIVPYNDEAKNIIVRLNDGISLQEAVKLQRKAQKYTVGVYSPELKELTNSGAVYMLSSGALALNEGYYDPTLGMISTGTAENYIF